jgi:signal recognition particle subunit SRP54
MLKRMGPLQGVLKLIPGMGKQLGDLDVDDKQLGRVEAIVLSMTAAERAIPHLIDGSRRQRIARGSGTTVQQVNQLLLARKEMEKLMKQMGKGKMPNLSALQNGGQQQTAQSYTRTASATKKSKNKRKKKARK